jgi:hypothetical protein
MKARLRATLGSKDGNGKSPSLVEIPTSNCLLRLVQNVRFPGDLGLLVGQPKPAQGKGAVELSSFHLAYYILSYRIVDGENDFKTRPFSAVCLLIE